MQNYIIFRLKVLYNKYRLGQKLKKKSTQFNYNKMF